MAIPRTVSILEESCNALRVGISDNRLGADDIVLGNQLLADALHSKAHQLDLVLGDSVDVIMLGQKRENPDGAVEFAGDLEIRFYLPVLAHRVGDNHRQIGPVPAGADHLALVPRVRSGKKAGVELVLIRDGVHEEVVRFMERSGAELDLELLSERGLASARSAADDDEGGSCHLKFFRFAFTF